ncbi:sodium/hydrogen exchanger 9B2-like isoform X2 [Cydia fagiglandana]|uniref:sodium/hydrogen exchanger 9B2-like isoform X2 n=1 Tax=Cydia fagiglandana TaxID=1458189 RepID=UPI002FEE0590
MNEDERLLVIMADRPREGDASSSSHSHEPQFPPIINSEKINKIDSVETVEAKSNTDQPTTATLCIQLLTLIILGLMAWGLAWSQWGDGWEWGGKWFKIGLVAAVAWGSGQALQALTTMPGMLAALFTGILAQNTGFLDMRDYIEIDGFLRKIYPVVVLGKGSLGWNVDYMRSNWQRVATLGGVPWLVEVVAVATCSRFLLNFPWIWGFLLGSVYCSLSWAVVMPGVARLSAASGSARNWAQLVSTAGGTDTALSVGVYGLIFSFIFTEENQLYKYIKAGSTLFVGVILGVAWGILAGLAPHPRDYYVAELRVLFVLVGGLFANFILVRLGWAGTAGVAVLACNATAAMFWARDGWKINNNPASTAYRVFWAACEPTVFAYTGTFFVIDNDLWDVMLIGLAILLICLTVRLTTAALVCWDMTLKERIFVCCTWVPKSIVEAVLAPTALTAVISRGPHQDYENDLACAVNILRLLVQAIIITTPIGYLLTNHLGPILLKVPKKSCDDKNIT